MGQEQYGDAFKRKHQSDNTDRYQPTAGYPNEAGKKLGIPRNGNRFFILEYGLEKKNANEEKHSKSPSQPGFNW